MMTLYLAGLLTLPLLFAAGAFSLLFAGLLRLPTGPVRGRAL